MKQPILVTGGAGYIGSHVCKALAKAGYLPVAYDNLSRGNRWAVKWGPLVEGDIADRAKLGAVLAEYHPEVVIHLAAFAYVGESAQKPELYYRNNVAGTLALLETMREVDVKRLVFSSTCATYGVPVENPISEAQSQFPINVYGRTKLAVEHMIGDFAQAYGLNHVTFRFFNAAGADPDGEIGEAHEPEPHLIPLAIAAAGENASELAIYGDTYPTADGTCVRDYLHVADIAQAHIDALTLLAKGESEFLNLGTGRGHSVMEIIRAVENCTGRSLRYRMAGPRVGDPATLVADAALATKRLGWMPRQSDLHSMVESACRWERSRAA